MTRNLKNAIIILVAFACYFLIQSLYFRDIYSWNLHYQGIPLLSYLITYFVVGIPLLAGLLLIRKPREVFSSAGFSLSSIRGFLPGFIFTLPMLIGYSLTLEFNETISLKTIVKGAVLAGFFEELYFRGFLFGMLFSHSRFGFIPAVLPGALFFGAGHLWQGEDVTTAAAIFLITFAGAVWFSWTYAEWNFNIWVPVSLHLFMNLYWMLFSAGDNAMGDMWVNIFRALTIALTIVGTLWYKRKKGLPLAINGRNLWLKKEPTY